MNPILQNYIKRYIDKDNKTQNANFPKFFTQYDLASYDQFLPYLFEIEGFCLRLFEALLCGDRICIYSDYDTDAMTATGTMYWGLVDLGFDQTKLSFYAPDRFAEGYGMNTEAIAKLVLENDLIISVDCGINSVLEAQIVLENLENQKTRKNPEKNSEKNSEKKCELIITDHHHLAGEVPNCVAVINPRLSEYWTDPQNAEKLAKIQNKLQTQSQKLEKIIANSDLENAFEKIDKIQNWLTKMQQKLDFKDQKEQKSNGNSEEIKQENLEKETLEQQKSENSTNNSTNQNSQKPANYLSSSTTGVGVAWFCLVWFGYFLKELE
jgi:DHH family